MNSKLGINFYNSENSWVTAPLPPMPDVSEEDSETTTLIQDDGERCQVKILSSK